MGEYHLNKVLYETARQHRIVEGITDEAVLGAYELSPDERQALQTGDIARLYELGANPYLIRRVFRPRFPI